MRNSHSRSLASPGNSPAQDQYNDLGEANRYSILYAGHPGGEREAAFVEFLKSWFSRVDTISLPELKPGSAEAYDVVVADWTRLQGKDGFQSSNRPRGNLTKAFDKPVILIGAVAGEVQRHSKINWL